MGDFLLQSDVRMTKRNLQRLQAEKKRMVLWKFPLQIAGLHVLCNSSYIFPSHLLATIEARSSSTSEIQGHFNVECVSSILSMKQYNFPCKKEQKALLILEGKGQMQHGQMHKRENRAPSENRKPFFVIISWLQGESCGPCFLGTFVVKNDSIMQNLFLSVHKHIKKIQPTHVFGLWKVQNFRYLLGRKSSLGF